MFINLWLAMSRLQKLQTYFNDMYSNDHISFCAACIRCDFINSILWAFKPTHHPSNSLPLCGHSFTLPDDVLRQCVVLTAKLSSACHTEPLIKITVQLASLMTEKSWDIVNYGQFSFVQSIDLTWQHYNNSKKSDHSSWTVDVTKYSFHPLD